MKQFIATLGRKSFAFFVIATLLLPNFSQPASAVSLDITPTETKTETTPEKDSTISEKQLAQTKAKLNEKAGSITIPFIKNEGQVASDEVKYYANIFAGSFFVTDNSFRYSIAQKEKTPKPEPNKDIPVDRIKAQEEKQNQITHKFAFDEQLLDENNQPITLNPQGEDQSKIAVTYFKGGETDPQKTTAENYNNLNLGEAWNNIDVKLKAYGSNIEKLFYVNPKGNTNDIQLKLSGIESIEKDEKGKLILATPLGDISMTAPVAYQEDEDGNKTNIEVAYDIKSDNTYGFTVGDYDKEKTLVIDPLLASTSFGSGDYMDVFTIETDVSGNVYAAGYCEAATFPTTVGAYDTVGVDDYRGYVSKFDSNLTTLLASTFLGTGDAALYDMTIDESGNVIVTGYTRDATFPTTAGAYDRIYGGNSRYDGFVSILNSSLSTLQYSTYVGGAQGDSLYGVAIDSAGNIFVAGISASVDYPIVAGYDATYGGSGDLVVSKFNPTLSTLSASTYLGGINEEGAYGGIIIDSSDKVYVYGDEWDTSTGFPTTAGAYQTTFHGSYDVFVSRFTNDLSTLEKSTLLGGVNQEYSQGIKINPDGNIVISGFSDSADFPTTSEAYQTVNKNSSYLDFFISILDPDLSSLDASTLLGGTNDEWWMIGSRSANSLDIDSDGNVFVATTSSSSDYPVTPGAYSELPLGGGDFFVVSKLSPDLQELLASTYFGGSEGNQGATIHLDADDNVYMGGWTYATNFPATEDAYSTVFSDNYDGYLSKLDNDLSGPLTDHLEVAIPDQLYAEGFEDSAELDNNWSISNMTSGANNLVYAAVVQPDDKILICGNFTSYNGVARNRIARLNTDGSLDTTFDPGLGASSGVNAFALQGDGKILIGGSFTTYNGTTRNRIARINSDGSLDATFAPVSGANNSVSGITLQGNGQIMIAGYFTTYNGTTRNRIARINSDGSLDATFAPTSGFSTSWVGSIAIQSDGKYIAGGNFTTYNGAARKNIVRINTDGSLDASFNPGTGVTSEVGYSSSVESIALKSDGKILIGGYFNYYNSTAINRIARLNADGSLDATFDTGAGTDGGVLDVIIQSDGNIMLGGSFDNYDGTARDNIVRIDSDGSLDTTFDPGAGTTGTIYAVPVRSDGEIFIGGNFTSYDNETRVRVASLSADGSLDVDFNPTTADDWFVDGSTSVSGTNSIASSMAILGGESRLSRVYDFPTDGEVSFYWKTTNTDYYNSLGFCLDMDPGLCSGMAQYVTYGVDTWTKVTILVSAGEHRFSWVHDKPPSGVSEAWIDDVEFTSLLHSDSIVAGTSQLIDFIAIDTDGAKQNTYSGNKSITLSGLDNSGGVPTCTDKDGVAVPFGMPTTITFVNGLATCSLVARTSEIASLDVTDGMFTSSADPTYDLDLTVTGGAPAPTLSPENSLLTVSPSPSAIGSLTVLILAAYDTDGNPYSTGGDLVNFTVTGANSITPTVTDNADGTYTASYIPTIAGNDQITATINSVPIGQDSDGMNDGVFHLIVSATPLPEPEPSPIPEPEEKEANYLKIKDYTKNKTTFDARISKGNSRTKAVSDLRDGGTELRELKLEAKKDKTIEGNFQVKKLSKAPLSIVLPSEYTSSNCIAYKYLNIDAEFSESKIEEVKFKFNISKNWLKTNQIEKLFILSSTTKSAKLKKEKTIKDNSKDLTVSFTSDKLSGWWTIVGCAQEAETAEPLTETITEPPVVETPIFPTESTTQPEEQPHPIVEAPTPKPNHENIAGVSISQLIKNNPNSATALVGTLLLLPLLSILANLGNLSDFPLLLKEGIARLFGLFLYRKKYPKDWGVVYDIHKGKPVPLARVDITDAITGKLKESKLSDKYGSYFFLVPQGSYQLEVTKPGFATPKTPNSDWQTLYQNSYQGETLNFTQTDKIAQDLPLEQLTEIKKSFLTNHFFITLFTLLFWLGLPLNLVICFIAPKPLNFLILLAYLYIAFLKDLTLTKAKWGSVLNQENIRQPFATVKLLDAAHNQLVTRTITDETGRYFLVANAGHYQLKVTAVGAEGRTSEQDIILAQRDSVKETVVV